MRRCTLGYRTLSMRSRRPKRDFSACTLGSGDRILLHRFGDLAPGAVRAGQPGSGGVRLPADPNNGYFTIDGANDFRPYDFATDLYNFGPLNYYQRPDERYTAGLFAHYDLNDHATAYTEFMFMDDTHGLADRTERRVLRFQQRPAAVLRQLRGQLRQSVPVGLAGQRAVQ